MIVNKSRSVCVGCCPAPSPQLITGISETSDANLAEPSLGCLRTTASEYAETILIVSARVSPFKWEVEEGSAKPIQLPPNLCIALSKDSLVLVEASKKHVARILPYKTLDFVSHLATVSKSFARFRMSMMLFLSKSSMDTMCFMHLQRRGFFKLIMYLRPSSLNLIFSLP